MNKLVSILLLALLTITAANAQNFEVGANSGVTFNKWTGNNVSNPFSERQNTDQLHTYTLALMKNTKKWQYGLSFLYSYDAYTYSYTFIGDYYYPSGIITQPPPMMVTAYTRDDAFRAFVKRKLTTGRFELYIGASAGDLLTHSAYTEYSETQKTNSSFVTAGTQAGATWFATKHIGINAEVSDEYLFTFNDAFKGQMVYRVTVGIRYRL